MQRVVCGKLRSLTVQSRQITNLPSLSSSHLLLRHRRRHHHDASPLPLHFASLTKWTFSPILNLPSSSNHIYPSLLSSSLPLSLVQVRHVSSRDRRSRRKPTTPATSKLKKTKIKPYSSYNSRFRTMNDGNIRRWREGKNHNAHSKSKKSKRRLRQPALVPAAYAKVMKKLNFYG